MKRSTFFKSLIAVIAAPKILSEIKWAKPKPKLNKAILSDLKFIVPTWCKDLHEKYGDEDWLELYNKTGYLYYRGNDVVSLPTAGEPVTITITKDNYGGIESI